MIRIDAHDHVEAEVSGQAQELVEIARALLKVVCVRQRLVSAPHDLDLERVQTELDDLIERADPVLESDSVKGKFSGAESKRPLLVHSIRLVVPIVVFVVVYEHHVEEKLAFFTVISLERQIL